MEGKSHEKKYILALDVGTTRIKAFVYDENLLTVSKASRPFVEHSPQPGWSEIVPDELWKAVVNSCQEAISASGINASKISAFGISAQRNTFITCDSKTGKPFHNFITWKDKRAEQLAAKWNASPPLQAMREIVKDLQILCPHTIIRLLWVLENCKELQAAVDEGRARFGNLETWLIWKLTGGKTWVAEATGLMTSAMYNGNPDWDQLFLSFFGIPESILPQITDSIGSEYGQIEESIFGASIPITAVLADQSASLVGECCFAENSLKITVGTGGFLSVVTGRKPTALTGHVFPTMVLKNGSDVIFAAEVYLPAAFYVGSIIDSLVSDGYLDDINKLDEVANSVEDAGGVVVVVNQGDGKEGHQIQGKTESTKPAHVVRAAVLAITTIMKDLALQFETEAPDIDIFGNKDMAGNILPPVRVDGGVSQSDAVCQAIANALNRNVERLDDVEASARGIAMLAGLGAKVFPSMERLEQLALGEDDGPRKFKAFQPCP